MNQISPFKSSAFRITLVYVLLFGLSVAIILGFVYWSTIAYQDRQTEDSINAEIDELSKVYETKGYPGLVTTLSQRVEQINPGDSTLYLLTDNQFRPLVTNISGWPRLAFDREGGWIDFRLDQVRDEGTQEFSARARVLEFDNRYNLLVGRALRDLANIKELVGRALVWGLLLTVALGLIGGFMLRQTLRSRLGAINQTLSLIHI